MRTETNKKMTLYTVNVCTGNEEAAFMSVYLFVFVATKVVFSLRRLAHSNDGTREVNMSHCILREMEAIHIDNIILKQKVEGKGNSK